MSGSLAATRKALPCLGPRNHPAGAVSCSNAQRFLFHQMNSTVALSMGPVAQNLNHIANLVQLQLLLLILLLIHLFVQNY